MSIRDRHDELVSLRGNHPAWRLLAADNASLVIGFCERVFLHPNVRSISPIPTSSRGSKTTSTPSTRSHPTLIRRR